MIGSIKNCVQERVLRDLFFTYYSICYTIKLAQTYLNMKRYYHILIFYSLSSPFRTQFWQILAKILNTKTFSITFIVDFSVENNLNFNYPVSSHSLALFEVEVF